MLETTGFAVVRLDFGNTFLLTPPVRSFDFVSGEGTFLLKLLGVTGGFWTSVVFVGASVVEFLLAFLSLFLFLLISRMSFLTADCIG